MTQGNSMKLIFQFFLPILIEIFFSSFTALWIPWSLERGSEMWLWQRLEIPVRYILILGFAMGLTGGLGICISHSFGANDIENCGKKLRCRFISALPLEL